MWVCKSVILYGFALGLFFFWFDDIHSVQRQWKIAWLGMLKMSRKLLMVSISKIHPDVHEPLLWLVTAWDCHTDQHCSNNNKHKTKSEDLPYLISSVVQHRPSLSAEVHLQSCRVSAHWFPKEKQCHVLTYAVSDVWTSFIPSYLFWGWCFLIDILVNLTTSLI